MKYSIVVNKGCFSSITEAANAEKNIDWWNESIAEAVYCTECFAALELKKYLDRVLDINSINSENVELVDAKLAYEDCRLPVSDNIILIGNTFTNQIIKYLEIEIGMTISANSNVLQDGFRLKVFKYSGSNIIVLSGYERAGTLNSVFAFLELLGIRWFGLGEKGTHYPKKLPDVMLTTDITDNPSYITRGCYSEYIDDTCDELIEWIMHNRMNYIRVLRVTNPHNLKKRGINICTGGHNILYRFMDPNTEYPFKHAVFGGEGKPDDPYPISNEYTGDLDGDGKLSYSEAHPEWFILINDKRRFKRDYEKMINGYFTGDNFCLSNRYAVNELCRLVVADLETGEWSKADFLDLWLMDNGIWCTCEACKSMGNYTDRLLQLVYALNKTIKEEAVAGRLNRKVSIIFPAYHETLPPPEKPLPDDFDYGSCLVTIFPIERCYVHFIDDECCTETNRYLNRRYTAWTLSGKGHYKGNIFIGEYYNVSSFASMPIPLRKIITHDILYYYETGTRHFYYMHTTAKNWGVLTLNNYLHVKMLWNPYLDSEKLVDEYFTLYYGEAADAMKQFYEKLEKAMANMKYIKHYQQKDDHEILSIWCKIASGDGELFPLKHVQYSGSMDDPNAGIGFTDTLRLMDECRYILDDVLLKANDNDVSARLLEDESGLVYGDLMLKFFYYMIRTSLFINGGKKISAAMSFKHAKTYAELLYNTKDALDGYFFGKEYENGLSASWMEKIYREYSDKYSTIV